MTAAKTTPRKTPEQLSEKIKPPRQYRVVLLNDDYTPMDFVVSILTGIFSLPQETAVAVMLSVHESGRGVCGVYQKDIAETHCARVTALAGAEGYPLKCIVEPA